MPKKASQTKVEKPKIDAECRSCIHNQWIELDKRYYCENCQSNIKKQKHQLTKKGT